jgi:NADH-quinone oxidoreductase subunit L
MVLAGFPGTSGFFSKDEILVFAAERGGMYWAFAIAGYAAAFLTALYSFRIAFRVCLGRECKEARWLRTRGELAHAEPENPLTGEAEDTKVGFPGSEHHIAERSRSMTFAMATLGLLALTAGLLQVPGLSDSVEKFLEPSFADSVFADQVPSTGAAWLGLAVGAATALAGIGLAAVLYLRAPGATDRIRATLRPVHTFLINKWYFDELYDVTIVRPTLAVGRFANSVFERQVVQGLVTGTVGAMRGASGAVRTVQSGFLRSYALLLVGGFAGLGLYFLIVSS